MRLEDYLSEREPSLFSRALKQVNLTPEDVRQMNISLTQNHLDTILLFIRQFYPQVTLELFARAEVVDLGLVGYAAINSDNIGAALNVMFQYHSIASDRYSDELSVMGDIARIRPIPLPGYGDDFINICEDSLSGNWRAIRLLLGPTAVSEQIRVKLEYPAPNYQTSYTSIFGENCQFQTDTTGLFFPAKWLQLPVHRGTGTLSELYKAMCERVLGPGAQTSDTLNQVRRLLIGRAGREVPSLEQAAQSLNMTVSQLRKRLYKSDTTYKAQVLAVRMELARQYLLATQLSVQEIAFLLDYSTAPPFSRAFKTQHGVSPERFRQSHREADGSEM